jgi:hypothetical protein
VPLHLFWVKTSFYPMDWMLRAVGPGLTSLTLAHVTLREETHATPWIDLLHSVHGYCQDLQYVSIADGSDLEEEAAFAPGEGMTWHGDSRARGTLYATLCGWLTRDPAFPQVAPLRGLVDGGSPWEWSLAMDPSFYFTW